MGGPPGPAPGGGIASGGGIGIGGGAPGLIVLSYTSVQHEVPRNVIARQWPQPFKILSALRQNPAMDVPPPTQDGDGSTVDLIDED